MGWMQGKAGQPEPNQPKSHKPQTGEQPRRKQEGGADGGPGHGCSGKKGPNVPLNVKTQLSGVLAKKTLFLDRKLEAL